MAVVVLTLAAIASPLLAVGGFAAVAALLVLAKVSGWWRRAYVVTILAMFAGASHMESLALVGSLGKVAALALLAMVTFATTSKGEYRNRVHKFTLRALWATVALAAVSVIWSVARLETAMQVFMFAAFVFILHRISTSRWVDRDIIRGDMSTGYWASVLALTVGAAMAAAGVTGAVSSFDGRHLGILNNPNLLGMVAAITLVVGVGVAMSRRNPLVWASLSIPLSQVFLSQSRTALVAVAVGLLWAVLRGGIVRTVVVAGAALIATLVASAYRFNPFGDMLSRFGEREGGDLLNQRTVAWADVFQYVGHNPLGAGWGATPNALEQLGAAGIGSGLSSIHNSYLQIIFELGWIGLLPSMLSIAILVTVAVWANADKVGTGLVATVVTGTVIQITESAIFGIGQPYPYLFWFAVLAAIANTEPRAKRERGPTRGKFFTLEPGTGKVRAVH